MRIRVRIVVEIGDDGTEFSRTIARAPFGDNPRHAAGHVEEIAEDALTDIVRFVAGGEPAYRTGWGPVVARAARDALFTDPAEPR